MLIVSSLFSIPEIPIHVYSLKYSLTVVLAYFIIIYASHSS